LNNENKKCYEKSQIPIDEYFLNGDNTTYYSCNNTLYNSIENCKKCTNNNTCHLCHENYTFIEGNKSICIKKEGIEGRFIPDINDISNYIKCSSFIENCSVCNSTQCYLCNEGYIFINDNFSECILKESINLDFYFSNDNLTYYSCNSDKFKDNEKYKISKSSEVSFNESIQEYDITSIKIDLNESTIMSSLNNKNLNDLSSSLITNIPTLSTSGPVIGGNISYITSSIITTIPIINNNISDITPSFITNIPIISTNISDIATSFITTVSTFNNNISYITPSIITTVPTIINNISYITSSIITTVPIIYETISNNTSNFAISKEEIFIFVIKIYSINSGRILQQNEMKDFEFIYSKNYGENDESIIELTSKEELNENLKATFVDSKNMNDISIKLNDNKNNLDSEKVKEEIKNGGMNYNDITSDLKIYHYSILSSSEGCNFVLNTEENIENTYRIIYLNFKEISNDKKDIKVRCILSNTNGKKIPCFLYEKIYNKYTLQPYLYSENNEIITITKSDDNNNNNNNFDLQCSIYTEYNPDNPNNPVNRFKKKSNRLSTGVIIEIICSVVGVIVALTIAIIFVRRSRIKKSTQKRNDISIYNSDIELNK